MRRVFAVRNLFRLGVIWMKRFSSGVSFLSAWLISGGPKPTFFARNDSLFGKQLFYEYQNEQQHN